MRKFMDIWTVEQCKQAEEIAISVIRETRRVTPLDTLAMLSLALARIEHGTTLDDLPEKYLNDAGLWLLTHYQLSKRFPYTNREITDYLLTVMHPGWELAPDFQFTFEQDRKES